MKYSQAISCVRCVYKTNISGTILVLIIRALIARENFTASSQYNSCRPYTKVYSLFNVCLFFIQLHYMINWKSINCGC